MKNYYQANTNRLEHEIKVDIPFEEWDGVESIIFILQVNMKYITRVIN